MLRLLAAALLTAFAPMASAETHEVKMLNRNDAGPMPYEPDFLVIEPGDTVKFLATTASHNAATIDGFLPEGAEPFRGNINEEIEVTLSEPGFYGVKCLPHYAMGMVMLIQVGEASLEDLTLPAGVPPRALRRFEEIIARVSDG